MVYYGVSKDKVVELRQTFVRRRDDGSLFKPYPISKIKALFVENNKQEEVKEEEKEPSKTLTLAKELFGDYVKEE